MEWEIVNKNMVENIHCRLDRIEIEEGYLYRHITYDDSGTVVSNVALVFVEKGRN